MLISVCIPVFNGEKYLQRCLESVAKQTYKTFEVIVVDDCSPGKDKDGRDCKKICKSFTKQTKIKVNYIRNSKNSGCIESRRRAVYEASGDYIFCLDCDDTIEPDCLEKMAQKALEENAEIVHCGANVVFANEQNLDENNISAKDLENRDSMAAKANLLYNGVLLNEKVFDYALITHEINYFVWGKLIQRDVFINAWEQIPPCYCVWGEDYVIYFFAAYFSKKYIGITDKLYNYSVDTGISSNNIIDTLERYEKICSVSSAFSIIFEAIRSGSINITKEQEEAIQRQCNTYLLTNIRYLKYFATDDIKQDGYKILCEYWGKTYVEKVIELTGEHPF